MRSAPDQPEREASVLLARIREGDSDATKALYALVHDELHRLAGAYMARERQDHTLQPTALVNEAFLHLVGTPGAQWESRAHFFRVAAMAMRNVLVNHARDRRRLKRGGSAVRVPLIDIDAPQSDPSPEEDILDLHVALEKLAEVDDRKAQVVQLRHFGGCSIEQTAWILDISPAQVKRDWTIGRAFLLRELGGEAPS